jgi:hypothetical protein
MLPPEIDPAGKDLKGSVVFFQQHALNLPAREHLFLVTGGPGAAPISVDTKLYGVFLSDGLRTFIPRAIVERIAREEELPDAQRAILDRERDGRLRVAVTLGGIGDLTGTVVVFMDYRGAEMTDSPFLVTEDRRVTCERDDLRGIVLSRRKPKPSAMPRRRLRLLDENELTHKERTLLPEVRGDGYGEV